MITFDIKVLNTFELKGLSTILDLHLNYTTEEETCGTSSNNLANMQNTEYEITPPEFKQLGGFGLSTSNDMIFNFWNDEGENKYYWLSYSDLICSDNPEFKECNISKK